MTHLSQMSKLQANASRVNPSIGKRKLSFEIFVRNGFSALEVSSVTSVLKLADTLSKDVSLNWTIASDTPGLIASDCELTVRAGPATKASLLPDCLIVVGGMSCGDSVWMQRVRAMQKCRKPVYLLSEAATAFIKACAPFEGPITTHWKDAYSLHMQGDFPTLTKSLAEENAGITTCAGSGHTVELMLRALSEVLGAQHLAELASLLVLERARSAGLEQPLGASSTRNFLDAHLSSVISIMEASIEEPRLMADIAQEVGLSVRQLERKFACQLGTTPAKHYRLLRLKRARSLVLDTELSAREIATASGFESYSHFNKIYIQEYGESIRQSRRNLHGVSE